MEGPFLHLGADGKLAVYAFKAWAAVIDSMKAAAQFSSPKRVALLVKPMYHALVLSSHVLVHQACTLSPAFSQIPVLRCKQAFFIDSLPSSAASSLISDTL